MDDAGGSGSRCACAGVAVGRARRVSLGFALRIVELKGARRLPAVVLRDVGELVRKKTLTVCTLRVVAAKHDIGPDGVAIGVDGACGPPRDRVVVHADLAEVTSEPVPHRRHRGVVERVARRLEPPLHDRRVERLLLQRRG